MRNRIEFEQRVREIAANKKKATARNIRKFTAIGGGVLIAASLMLVIIKFGPTLVREKTYDKTASSNTNKGEVGGSLMDEMENATEFQPDGFDNNPGSNQENAGVDGNGGMQDEEVIFVEVESISLTCQPAGETVTVESGRIFYLVDWLDELSLTDTGRQENNSNGAIYMLTLHYTDGSEVEYVVADNYIKEGDGNWMEFDVSFRESFIKIVGIYMEVPND